MGRVLRWMLSAILGLMVCTVIGLVLPDLARWFLPEWEWTATAGTHDPMRLDGFKPLVAPRPNSPLWARELAGRFVGMANVARVRVWDRDGAFLWTSDAGGGAELSAPPEWQRARAGKVVLSVTAADTQQPREPGAPFQIRAMAYLPIVSSIDGDVLGVLELRETPGRLRSTRPRIRLLAWTIAVASGLASVFATRPAARQRRDAGQPLPRQSHTVAPERLRAFNVMAGGVVHDVNNVLTAILGRTQMLRRRIDAREDPELERHLQVLEQVALDGSHAVQRLLGVAREWPSGTRPPVFLHRVIEDVLETTRPRWSEEARCQGIEFDVRVCLTPVPSIVGEASDLREAVTNIVLNALEAMPDGGTLRIATGLEGSAVICTITDTGLGMPEAVRRRIFDPWFTTKVQGTGLGLSMVRDLIKQSGGVIEVHSRRGAGTTVTLRFPLAGPADVCAP